jgi:hypothetical protein
MVQMYEDQPSFASQFMKSGMDTATAFGKAFLEKRFRNKQLEDEDKAAEEMGIRTRGFKDPEIRKMMIAEQLKGQTSQMKIAAKQKEKEAENQENLKGITETADWLDKNLKYSGSFGVHPKWGGIEAQGEGGGLGLRDESGKQMSDLEIKAKREGIDRSGVWLADKVYTHFNKGVINQTKWEDVKGEFAVKSDLPAAINRERVAAVKRIMGLPANAPPSVIDKVIDTEKKTLAKIEKAKGSKSKNIKLTDEIANSIYDEAKGNVEEARRIAKERGYIW